MLEERLIQPIQEEQAFALNEARIRLVSLGR
jgi:hypothetical protein